MWHLYWEAWPWTRGSLHDVATHAGRCSSIMRHFITERQPPGINRVWGWLTGLRDYRCGTRFLRGKTIFCFWISSSPKLLFLFCCGNKSSPHEVSGLWPLLNFLLVSCAQSRVRPVGLNGEKAARTEVCLIVQRSYFHFADGTNQRLKGRGVR